MMRTTAKNPAITPIPVQLSEPEFTENRLRVLGTAELPHIDQGVRHQFHAKMSSLPMFETKEEPLEFILPGESPIDTSPQGMDRGIE
jgi:hypothetical protein